MADIEAKMGETPILASIVILANTHKLQVISRQHQFIFAKIVKLEKYTL